MNVDVQQNDYAYHTNEPYRIAEAEDRLISLLQDLQCRRKHRTENPTTRRQRLKPEASREPFKPVRLESNYPTFLSHDFILARPRPYTLETKESRAVCHGA